MKTSKNVNTDLLKEPITGDRLESPAAYFRSTTNGVANETSLNGDWKFVYADKAEEKYLDPSFDISALKDIKVPSQIELNGYSRPQYLNIMYPWEGREDVMFWDVPQNNPVGIYFKDIKIKTLSDKDIFLEINGFEASIYLYINGYYVGYSSNGFNTNRFLINSFLIKGNNRIVIVDYRFSISSWVTDQDMWRMSGLFRDVNLLELPISHFEDIVSRSVLKTDLQTGYLDVSFTIANPDPSLSLNVKLSKDGKTYLEKSFKANEGEIKVQEDLSKVQVWSDEDPNLYQLNAELKAGDNNVQTVSINIGFRRLDIKNGILLLNGKRLIIRGVNRHEFTTEGGRVISPEQTEEDIKLLKSYNFNAIRCSHYPDITAFYDLCDKYGILVCDEAPIETHGTWATISVDKKKDKTDYILPGNDDKYMEFIVDRGRRMLKRDINHPAIIFWSLGNESYAGKNLQALADYFRAEDPTRLVHYESNSWEYPKWQDMSDVTSRMYTHADEIAKFLDKHEEKPFILCEFEHSMGNSTGNFDEYMALADKYPHYQGGFIWDFVDQGLTLNGKTYFGGDFGEYPNDGNFCADGLLLTDRSTTSKTEAVKYYYQPLKFTIAADHVSIKNDRLFKDTSDLLFRFELFHNGIIIKNEDFRLAVKPGEKADYYFKSPCECLEDGYYYAQIHALLSADTAFNKKGYSLMKEETFLKGSYDKPDFIHLEPKDGKVEVFQSVNHITVQVDDFQVLFNGIGKGVGGLDAIFQGGKRYLYNPVYPTLYRPTTDNDMAVSKYTQSFYLGCSVYPIYNPLKRPIEVTYKDEHKAVIKVHYDMISGVIFSPFDITYTVYSDKTIQVDLTYKRAPLLPPPPLVGLKFLFDKENSSFSYTGLGPLENYIDRFKGQEYGIYKSDAGKEFVPYSKPQECGNHCFTRRVRIPVFDNSGLEFLALDKTFSFKYLPYSEMEIELAQRKENLPYSRFNYLTIAAFNKGVGGDDSWGSPVHKAYLLNDKTVSLSFLIRTFSSKE